MPTGCGASYQRWLRRDYRLVRGSLTSWMASWPPHPALRVSALGWACPVAVTARE